MSSSAIRRTKERSISVGRVLPSATSKTFKPLSPVPFTNGTGESLKKSTGIENSRNTSRGRATILTTQKPVLLPMPRIDKTSSVSQGDGKDLRFRRSTSSAPRGRSSSPSDFTRVLSDMRKSRVSIDRDIHGSTLVGGKSVSGVKGSDLQKKGSLRILKPKSSEIDGSRSNSVHVLEKSRSLNESSVLDQPKRDNDLSSNNTLKSCSSSSVERTSMSNNSVDVAVKTANCVDLDVKQSGGKAPISSKVTEVPKQKVVTEEAGGGRSMNKYPSKLHEKLAFLEGKVKRIASDIKRTKEMLDHNNPDASKFILSDIQEKISGIEKAMGQVGICADAKTDVTKASDIENGVHNAKNSVKGLSTEELEARLFPHHRLLRDRSSSGSVVGSTIDQSKTEEKSSSLIDGTSIAKDFLASINKEKPSKVTMRGECGSLQSSNTHETDVCISSAIQESSSDIVLANQFDTQENKASTMVEDETDDSYLYKLHNIGSKTSTGGWFVSEGEAVLLAHDDSSCSFYDIANSEEKAEYKPPVRLSSNLWKDCWIIRAPGSDGCAQRYVVAASAGNTKESGFCSWDFYTKDVKAFHIEEDKSTKKINRTALAPLPNNNILQRETDLSFPQWWHKPCGPLMVSAASSQKSVRIYDIRDGEEMMNWEVQRPVLTMDYSSSLQWRNRDKVVVAECEGISLWDVSSPSSQSLVYVRSSGKKITALHVNNTDAELGGGVRQRASSSETEGHDGVFCTTDLINVLDFRTPSGVGIKMPKLGINAQCVFSRGDSVYIGCINSRGRNQPHSPSSLSQIQQFSIRKQSMTNVYTLPESSTITQVWGNSNFVMGVCELGLHVFECSNDVSPIDDELLNAREVIGPEDMDSPSFDYLSSRVLIISRDRPAVWSHLF
ncbi:KIN14B-interacting protein At4g14310 [Impatiens glandulifera]|uniref:KIN14B-interacting protein At4g14310 n=1 Tax=Impatiens glandulifera TaxID=253017 RepID=UPI001FB0FAB8|nr:KIN14B-interacting protein At4g14310 [Impatiens glandulifera]